MNEPRLQNFLTDVIDADLAAGRVPDGAVVTRFPPEPNGFLHIGHAKSICLNFGLALQYGGRCHMRFDDTNPLAEDTRYVEAIQRDIRWLGFDWGAHLHFASDYFARMFEVALHLVDKGLAYVDDQNVEQIREGRGSFERPGVDSPWRTRSVADNRALLLAMRAGEFPDGARVLRAKIDMAHPNMLMRDPLLYRIRHAHHHRTGDGWCVYPMYDFAHCLEDAFEGVSHSICTLEFESNRELYDWVLDQVADRWPWRPRPRQYEFARLRLGYTVMSKRKLLTLVNEMFVDGWDDPRMPTIAGMRRRGYTAAALRTFAERVGVAKNNSLVDIGKLEHCVRGDLEATARRALAVLEPISLLIDGLPADSAATLALPWWPGEAERGGVRDVPFGPALLVERGDYANPAPRGWKRMSPGAHVRLFGACVVRIDGEIRDETSWQVVGLRATALPETLDGSQPADVDVVGVIHWVEARRGLRAEVRLYDRLFSVEEPEQDGADFRAALHPTSLRICAEAVLEPALATAEAGTAFQFLRLGYFARDSGPVGLELPAGAGACAADGRPVWNRTITLRDTWARASGEAGDDNRPERRGHRGGEVIDASAAEATREQARAAAHAADHALAARHTALVAAGLGAEDADVIAADDALAAALEAGRGVGGDAVTLARWLRHEVRGALAGRPLSSPEGFGRRLARLQELVAAAALPLPAARRVLAEMIATEREPAALVEELGLAPQGEAALTTALAAATAAHPVEAARLRAGEAKLVGFFVGKVMAALRGAADAQDVRRAVQTLVGDGRAG